jgi:hypothetical protein
LAWHLFAKWKTAARQGSQTGGEPLIVGAAGISAAVVGIFEHAIERNARPERVGGGQRIDVVIGVERPDAIGTRGFFVVAA